MNILVTRTDRLGDVLLATPVLKKLKLTYPEAKITFLVQQQWAEILKLPGVELMIYTPGDRGLSQEIKNKNFDIAIVLRDEKEVSRAIGKARVPIRVGPYSSLRSFFVFNRGILQQRSKCKMHEAEYNLQLLDRLPNMPKLIPAQSAKDLPRSWIGYSSGETNALEKNKFICVHPGSSGSARYLRPEMMIALVSKLKNSGIDVVLTGSNQEKDYLQKIAREAGIAENRIFFNRPLAELAELYKNSLGVVAHGTGPLHLAAAVDAHVFAIFPPIFVLSEKRWGPLTEKRFTWVPNVNCPATYRCIGEKCGYYDCMDRFLVDEAAQKILQWKKGNS